MRPVGVLGGMGPEATVLFMSRVLAAVPARNDADHIPLLVDQNPQVPSRIKALLEGGTEDPCPVLAGMARRLARAGAEALVMPCNTAHHYAPAIRAAAGVPLISMVDLAAAQASVLAPRGRIGLLGSPALAKVGVFDAPLAACGLSLTPLADAEATLETIRRIKADGPSAQAIRQLSTEAAAQAAAGAEAICICCTEFSLVAREIQAPVPVFDALDLLVEATVRFARDGHVPDAHPAAPAAPTSDRETETS
ncbi:aspartate/glutamate racemase family protein [Pseudaestuariivita sp.]|uniref:aspartate/glutamate racemase family protein n=1 Tax=Pseudaestuariivita sp. TaxID=2211669 RepID=UPI0040599948